MRARVIGGFTLIELMMVVAIIGILAAISVPNFIKFSCRSRTTEAKVMLKHITVAQEAYLAEFDTYAMGTGSDLPSKLDAKMQSTVDPEYDYFISAADTTSYVAVALGKPGRRMAGDHWEIDETLTLSYISATADCQ